MTEISYTNERENMLSKQIAIKMTPKLYQSIEQESKKNNLPKSVIIRTALEVGISYLKSRNY